MNLPFNCFRLIMTASVLAICTGATATTLHVPSEYATIQSAIDSSYAGDVVEVGPGIYTESLNFGGRAIIVRSTAGAIETVVDPVNGRCFTASGQKGASARLEGFTLRGGSAGQGGGIYVQSSSPTVANCVIIANSATSQGGGVYVESGNPKLINCTVSANQGYQSGGGIYVSSGSISLEGCTVVGNLLTYPYYTSGGGLFFASSNATATITGGEIRSNSATYGGGIYGGTVSITNCAIGGNVSQYPGGDIGHGGGIDSSSVTITGGSLTDNMTDGSGGALYNVSGQVNGCMISGNTAVLDGGAVWSSGALTLSWCTLEENTASATGGAWYKSSGTAVVQSCQVKNNNALTTGGLWLGGGLTTVLGSTFCGNGVNITGQWMNAGGNTLQGACDGSGATTLHVPSEYATIQSAIDSSYAGDVVEVGPGIYTESLNFGGRAIIVRSTAGAIETVVDPVNGRCFTASGQKGASARLEGFTLRGGSAGQGGGIYVQSSSPTVANCVIIANSATSQGGGVYVESGNPKLINCTVSANQGYQSGGGIYVSSGSISLEGCTVVGNLLTYPYYTSGGGLFFASSNATATITGGEIRSNSATYGGGIYGGTVSITNCAIGGNVSQYPGGDIGHGGGIDSSSVTITGGSLTDNMTDGSGGALYNVSGQVNGCMISGNTAVLDGGAVWSSGALTLSWCTLEENTASATGGAWYKSSGTAVVQSCQVKNNNALTTGGLWLGGGLTTVLGSTFCGNGVNITGQWMNAGGNTLQGACDGSGATTLHVPSEYATIQSAIDSSYAGDVVEVGPGIYTESLNFGGRAIIVRSTAGAIETVVDPVNGRCFTASGQKGASARLEGFTLRGGSAGQGGGIYVQSSSPTVANCVIIANSATSQGGGVYVESGNPKLINCTISANQGYQSGGGICVSSGSISLEGCTVVGNLLTYPYYTSGGGLFFASSNATATITGGEIRSNSATYGGGIYGGTVSITNCAIGGNVSQYPGGDIGHGGGIDSSSVTITGGSLTDNMTDGSGGALYNVSGQVNGCMISGNTAVLDGGAVWSSGALTLSWCTLEENTASATGCAWYKSSGTAVVQSCQVKNNNALTTGGLWLGGGLTTVLGSTFCGNGVNITGQWVDAGANAFNVYCAPQCPGDSTGDGLINGLDLGVMLGLWGPCSGAECIADFTGDGVVSGNDLSFLLASWGTCADH